MIANIFHLGAHTDREPRGHGRTRPGVGVSRIRLEVEVDLIPQGKHVALDGQPRMHTQTRRRMKVAALKSAVWSGIYNVSAEEIAEHMLTATLVDLRVEGFSGGNAGRVTDDRL